MNRNAALKLGLLAAGCAVAACIPAPSPFQQAGRPDLAPERLETQHESGLAYCRLVSHPEARDSLVVGVRNLGSRSAAGAVRVEFSGAHSRLVLTPVILPGKADTVLVEVPPLRTPGTWVFTIIVDPQNTLLENDETNNRAVGYCLS